MDQNLDIHLDLGGMSPGARSLIPGSWEVPADFRLDDAAGLLCWTGELRPVQPRKRLLRDFLKIWHPDNAEKSDAAILRFAQQWGPLWLCDEHQRPIMHRWGDVGEFARALAGKESLSDCGVRKLGDGWFGEPLDAWRRLSGQAHLIIEAGSLARRGKLRFAAHEHLLADVLDLPRNTPPRELRAAYLSRLVLTEHTWASLGWFRDLIELGMLGDLPETLADLMVGRVRDTIGTKKQFAQTLRQPDAIAEKINQWITDGGGFRQKAVWREDNPEWQQEVPSLYASIGVGLWNVIGDLTIRAKCKHCGQAFTPKTTTQLYCNEPECRRAKNRLNQRRSRTNRAAKLEVS